jgi:hypothetical protein
VPNLLQDDGFDLVRIVDDDQDRVAGIAAILQELAGDIPQFARRTADIGESDLHEELAVEALFAMAALVDGDERNLVAEACDVLVQQCRFTRTARTAQGNETVGPLRGVAQMLHQQRILFGLEELGLFDDRRERGLRQPEEFEIRRRNSGLFKRIRQVPIAFLLSFWPGRPLDTRGDPGLVVSMVLAGASADPVRTVIQAIARL